MSTNASPSDNSDGHDESTDHEQRTDGGDETPDREAAYEFLSRLMAPEGPLATGDDEEATDLLAGAAEAFGIDITSIHASERVEQPFYELREGIETGTREQIETALLELADVYDVEEPGPDWERSARKALDHLLWHAEDDLKASLGTIHHHLKAHTDEDLEADDIKQFRRDFYDVQMFVEDFLVPVVEGVEPYEAATTNLNYGQLADALDLRWEDVRDLPRKSEIEDAEDRDVSVERGLQAVDEHLNPARNALVMEDQDVEKAKQELREALNILETVEEPAEEGEE